MCACVCRVLTRIVVSPQQGRAEGAAARRKHYEALLRVRAEHLARRRAHVGTRAAAAGRAAKQRRWYGDRGCAQLTLACVCHRRATAGASDAPLESAAVIGECSGRRHDEKLTRARAQELDSTGREHSSQGDGDDDPPPPSHAVSGAARALVLSTGRSLSSTGCASN
jgi:hypothetical protein